LPKEEGRGEGEQGVRITDRFRPNPRLMERTARDSFPPTPLAEEILQNAPNESLSISPTGASLPKFKRFSDRGVLMRIGTTHLDALFDRFGPQLAARNVPLPSRIPQHSACIDAYATLFSTPELLPEPLINTLLAIEEFAAPENEKLLHTVAAAAGIQ